MVGMLFDQLISGKAIGLINCIVVIGLINGIVVRSMFHEQTKAPNPWTKLAELNQRKRKGSIYNYDKRFPK